jgi:hypothetical protein
VSEAVFLLSTAPLGIIAAAWFACVAVRLRDSCDHVMDPRLECMRCRGADAPRDAVRRLLGGACRTCGSKPHTWVLRAQAGGAVLPALVLYAVPDPAQAAVVTVLGWLLLGIWIADETSLWIPHVFWATGILVGLAAIWHADGASGAGWRVWEVVVLGIALGAAAVAARALTRVAPAGPADYGVLAFIVAAVGYEAALDILLISGILGLGFAAVRAAPPAARAAPFALAILSVLAALMFGVPGTAAGAALLLVTLRTGRARSRRAALPLGACLAGGTFIVTTWTAPLEPRPEAAAPAGAAHPLLIPNSP